MTDWLDDLLRNLWLSMPGHDPDTTVPWTCGRCPYMNVGPVCTKCGAGREDGTVVVPSSGRSGR